jgi:hypothetical protein
MNCPNCAATVTDQDAFCGECGAPLPIKPLADEPVSVEQAARSPAGPPHYKEPAPQPPEPLAYDAVPPPQISVGAQVPSGAEPSPAPLPPPASAPAWGALPGPAATSTSPQKSRSRTIRIVALAGASAAILLCACVALGAFILSRAPAVRQAITNSAPGAILYEQDFEGMAHTWTTYSDEDTSAEYKDGEYRLTISSPDFMTWGRPEVPHTFSDSTVEVDARAVEGPLDNSLGLIVHYDDDNSSFYWFQISSDGWFAVDRSVGDEWETLVDWEESSAINQGLGATNRLAVTSSGSTYTFSVNGSFLITVTDTTLPPGSVGVAAGSFDEPGVVVHFDNLVVRAPEE